MRHTLTITLLAVLSAASARAQDRTLVGDDATYGGFGGPVLKFTRIAGKDAFLMGGRGAFVVNGTFAVGGGGAGWSSNHARGSDGLEHQMDFGYGGVDFEYINRTSALVHCTAQLTLGGGSATQDPTFHGMRREDSFFLAEPAVNAEVNVARGFRVAAGVSYRFVSGVELPAFADSDLRGAAVTLTFKFGKID
jgi:hypothetical protein